MRVNEIFYSLQGEGYHTGTAAVFLRFSGCNLRCPFCDTDHEEGTEMGVGEIVAAVRGFAARHIVITGGEPSLQLTDELVEALHEAGFTVQVETNGTGALPEGVDWVTCSPKQTGAFPGLALKRADELKIVFTGDNEEFICGFEWFDAKHRFLQPCDTGTPHLNREILRECVGFIKSHPQWRLSTQLHKLIGIQ